MSHVCCMQCLPQASVRLKAVTVLLPVLFVVQIIAVFTDYWVGYGSLYDAGNKGLFKDCRCRFPTPMISQPSHCHCLAIDDPPSWLSAVLVLEIIGIVGIGLNGISSVCCVGMSELPAGFRKFGIGWTFMTSLFILTGMVIYADSKPSHHHIRYSFGLCILSYIGHLICFILLCVDLRFYLCKKANDSRAGERVGDDQLSIARDPRGGEIGHASNNVPAVHPAPSAPSMPEPPTFNSPPPTYDSCKEAPPPSYDMLKSEGVI